MSLRFLGLSGHLVSGASGHFETFHKGLFKAFKEILGEENCNFLGSQSSEGENLWFEANLPDSLTSTIPFVSKGFLDSAFDSVDEVGNSHILYVYEGNLSNLFLIGNIARRKSNVFISIYLIPTNTTQNLNQKENLLFLNYYSYWLYGGLKEEFF